MSRDWLGYRTGKKSDKQKAIDGFESIGIGGFEIDEYKKMSVDDIENMTTELKEALRSYEDSLDSPEDVDTSRVMDIVKEVTLPYLEKADNWIAPREIEDFKRFLQNHENQNWEFTDIEK